MSPNFITTNRDQQYLFPPSVQDWLPEDHLARFVVDIVSQLNIRPLSEAYGGRGSKAYHPEIFYPYYSMGMPLGCIPAEKLNKQPTIPLLSVLFPSIPTLIMIP